MTDRSYRARSRGDWYPAQDGRSPTTNELAFGCLQRIADATEAMAKPYVAMLDEVRRLRQSAEFYESRITARDKQISALRGQVTKLKNQLAKKEAA